MMDSPSYFTVNTSGKMVEVSTRTHHTPQNPGEWEERKTEFIYTELGTRCYVFQRIPVGYNTFGPT